MKAKNPLVSVIIPTYNRCHLILRAINSVLKQNYSDYEVVVVDDCSEDDTNDIIKTIDDTRIRYVKHERKMGGSAARNSGIEVSRGNLIAFLDDDDEWFPEKLELQVDMFRKSPELGMVYTGYFYVNDENKKIIKVFLPNKKGHIYKDLLKFNCIGTTSTAMIRKECFEKIGYFDVDLRGCQDWDLWLRISREFEIGYIANPMANFFIHDVRVTNDIDAKIQGKELLLTKIFTEIKSSKKTLGYHYYVIGRLYCRKGDINYGKKLLYKAIKLNPFCLRYYKVFIPSLLGPKTFTKVTNLKQSIDKLFNKSV